MLYFRSYGEKIKLLQSYKSMGAGIGLVLSLLWIKINFFEFNTDVMLISSNILISIGWTISSAATLRALHATTLWHGRPPLQDAGKSGQQMCPPTSHGRHLRHIVSRQVPIHRWLNQGRRGEIRQRTSAGIATPAKIYFARLENSISAICETIKWRTLVFALSKPNVCYGQNIFSTHEAHKGSPVVFWSLNSAFWQKLS